MNVRDIRGCSKGFSIVELLVSAIIFAMASLAIVTYFQAAENQISRTRAKSFCSVANRSQMARLEAFDVQTQPLQVLVSAANNRVSPGLVADTNITQAFGVPLSEFGGAGMVPIRWADRGDAQGLFFEPDPADPSPLNPTLPMRFRPHLMIRSTQTFFMSLLNWSSSDLTGHPICNSDFGISNADPIIASFLPQDTNGDGINDTETWIRIRTYRLRTGHLNPCNYPLTQPFYTRPLQRREDVSNRTVTAYPAPPPPLPPPPPLNPVPNQVQVYSDMTAWENIGIHVRLRSRPIGSNDECVLEKRFSFTRDASGPNIADVTPNWEGIVPLTVADKCVNVNPGQTATLRVRYNMAEARERGVMLVCRNISVQREIVDASPMAPFNTRTCYAQRAGVWGYYNPSEVNFQWTAAPGVPYFPDSPYVPCDQVRVCDGVATNTAQQRFVNPNDPLPPTTEHYVEYENTYLDLPRDCEARVVATIVDMSGNIAQSAGTPSAAAAITLALGSTDPTIASCALTNASCPGGPDPTGYYWSCLSGGTVCP